MGMGGCQAEEHGQAGPTTEQRMHAVAPQEGEGMMGGGMADLGVGVRSAPGFDRGAVDDEVAGSDHAAAERLPHDKDEELLAGRGARGGRTLPRYGGAGPPEMSP